MGDKPLDLRPPPPTDAELMANGGRLGITLELRDMPYEEYLLTMHWKAIRERTFRIHGRRCFVCGSTRKIDVHHVHYDNLGDELEDDVFPLCHEHHETQHEILRHVMRARSHGQLGQFPKQ